MADTITIVGNVATDPERGSTATGIPTLSFRMATNHRRFDPNTGTYVDAGTNWFEIKVYRGLAENAGASLRKGDPLIVTGRLKLREWEGKDGRHGLAVEVEAENIGHDLRWGRTVYSRMSRQSASPSTAPAPAADAGSPGPGGDELAAVGAGSSASADAWAAPGTQVPF
ncbi:MAG: single-stranded DNA-binding protein [Actinobacteria bacterium]|nr:single-stranded DNA-binding protein [Actinomycetota bacterium]